MDAKGILILLVEDEPLIALNESLSLENHGYRVLSAHSGESALAVFREHPDLGLVLMDIDLGRGMDGTETARLMLLEREVPVVFLSSHTEKEIVEKTEQITSYGYVVKNSGDTVLDASIKMALKLHESRAAEKKKDEALIAATGLLKAAFESSLDALFIFKAKRNEEGAIVDFVFQELNARAEKMLSMDRESLVGKDLCAVLPVNIESGFFEKYRKVVETGEPLEEEFYLPETNVPAGWHYHQVTTIDNGIFISHRDITERKKIEETNAILAHMLDIAPGSITVHDSTGRFLYANRRTFEIHGYDEEGFMTVNLHDLDLHQNAALIEERLRLIDETGSSSFESAHYRKDGTVLPLQLFVKKVDWQGLPVYLSIATDISDQRRSEMALDYQRLSQKWFKRAFESRDSGICFVGTDGRFLKASAGLCLMLGYSETELLDLTFQDITPDEDRSIGGEYFTRMLAREIDRAVFEKRYIRKDGTTMYALVATSLVRDDDGSALCFVTQVLDMGNAEGQSAGQDIPGSHMSG